MEFYLFSHSVGKFIIPTDFQSMIFQRGRAQGPKSNEKSPSKIWFLDLGDQIVE